MRVIDMDWERVCFASWPVDPGLVERSLPDRVDVDTFDGRAYLSVVPFLMGRVRPRHAPRRVGLDFAELNLRTYVEVDGDPGIYFYNLDAADPVGVALARGLFSLPYYRADTHVERAPDDGTRFESTRTHGGVPPCEFAATYRPVEEPTTPDSGSLAEWLVERYRFYTEGRSRLWYGDVEHPPWRVADADIAFDDNDLFAANGFDHPAGDPHVVYSPGVPVTAHQLRPA
ncbi:DUF2071 domain-containing protein [Salarchaeum sp. III]|uniref:YqjF family protein n=1 Tax=Salarchaeum sp. III TaxID=3107927 RepID=UPI002EDAD657